MAEAKTEEQFIKEIAPIAQELAYNNDLYASVMIAQASLESGFGNSGLSFYDNNLFGIKGSYNGSGTEYSTLEDGEDGLYEIKATFRKYPSYKESLEDYVDLLKNQNANYYYGSWKSNTYNYQDATRWLTGKYATDRSYYKKLDRIIEKYNLTRFDKKPHEPIKQEKIKTDIMVTSLDNYSLVIPCEITKEIKLEYKQKVKIEQDEK